MGREVVEDGGEENATAATSSQITCLISQYVSSIDEVLSAVRLEYTSVMIRHAALLKITLLTKQVVG